MGQARPAGVCSFIQRLNYHNKTIDRPSLSRARTLSTVCEERVRRSVAILMTALCGGGGTTGAAGSYIAGVTLLTRRPSGRSMRYPLRQSIHYRARMQQQHDDGRTDGSVAQGRACFALLACMHCARGASTPTAVPSRANQTPLAIMVYFCWSGRGPGAGPHPRTDAPIPCKRRRDRHHWRAYGLSRCGGGTHEQCVAA